MGKLMTLSGGTGVGKSSVARALIALLPETFFMVTSLTTREKRTTDLAGEYAYTDTYDIANLNAHKRLLWWKKYGTTYYATTANSVRDALHRSGIGIMIITPDCVPLLHNRVQKHLGEEGRVTSFYIESPPISEIKRRLSIDGTRADMSSRITEERAWKAEAELSGKFLFVKNEKDQLERTVRKIRSHLDLSAW